MSQRIFEEDCPGCRPVLLDSRTKQPLPKDSPEMSAVMLVWGAASSAEKEAFHAACCNNSRDPADLGPAQALVARIRAAMPTN